MMGKPDTAEAGFGANKTGKAKLMVS